MSAGYVKQHYVPKFWLKKFRGVGNHLYARNEGKVGKVSPDGIMTEDHLYTVFNSRWQPDNSIEHALGALETIAGLTFIRLCDPNQTAAPDDRYVLCQFLGLQACRHPDVMNRGRRLAHELAKVLRDVHNYPDKAAFGVALSSYGLSQTVADGIFAIASTRTREQLQAEFDELTALSPQDPKLPVQDALRAHSYVAHTIENMTLELVSAAPTESFILGDTPMPQDLLGQGFTVPLGRSVALVATMGQTNAGLPRRASGAGEVDAINKTQTDNALHVVVGADPSLL